MAIRIPINNNDVLEISVGTPRPGKALVYLNVLTSDGLRGLRRTKKGFRLESAMVPFICEEVTKLLKQAGLK